MAVVGYRRVSSAEQRLDRQQLGEVDRLFDEHLSGKDRERPELDKCLAYLREGDTLRVHSVDRLARSLKDLLNIVEELTSRGVAVEFITNRLVFDPTDEDPFAVAMLSMAGVFAQLERDITTQRRNEGIALAKERGAYRGRAAALKPEEVRVARQRWRDGVTLARLVKDYGVSRTAMTNALNARGVYASPAYA